jgi:hypothetical protein
VVSKETSTQKGSRSISLVLSDKWRRRPRRRQQQRQQQQQLKPVGMGAASRARLGPLSGRRAAAGRPPPRGPRAARRRAARPACPIPGARSHCSFSNRGTDSVSETGVKQMNGGEKWQRDRALAQTGRIPTAPHSPTARARASRRRQPPAGCWAPPHTQRT